MLVVVPNPVDQILLSLSADMLIHNFVYHHLLTVLHHNNPQLGQLTIWEHLSIVQNEWLQEFCVEPRIHLWVVG